MKSNNVILSKPFLYFLIFLQIIAVLLLFDGTMDLLSQIYTYKGAYSFTETNAKCVRSKAYSNLSNNYSYNNTYEYIVDDNTYQIIFYGEKKEGKDRKLYYHPQYPPTCSKYKNLWIALFFNSFSFVLGLIAEVFFIKYLIKRRKANPYR